MSGTSSWGAQDLESDVQDAAREQARKHGLTLGEWLNQAILAHEEATRAADLSPKTGPYVGPSLESSGDGIGGGDTRRIAEALERLAERIDTSERRQALVVTGLDRAVLGLAARVEDAEAGVRQASTKVSGAVEEIRRKGDTLGQRVAEAETVARSAATEAADQLQAFEDARRALDIRLAESELLARWAAEEVGAALFEQANESHAELAQRIAETESLSRDVAAAAAREIAEAQQELDRKLQQAEAAIRSAADDTLRAVREEQSALKERVAFAENIGKTAASEAVRELQSVQETLLEKLRAVETEARAVAQAAVSDVRVAHDSLAARVLEISENTAGAEAITSLQARQEELAQRFSAVERSAEGAARSASDEVRTVQQALEQRLEQIEQSTRESASNLRMGAAAAINQVRAAQLELEKRVRVVETAPPVAGLDGENLRETFSTLESRIDKIERGGGDRAALHMLDAKITGLAASMRESRERATQDIDALRSRLESGVAGAAAPEVTGRLEQVERTVEDAISRLAERLESAESTANEALRRLDASPGAQADTDAVRAMVEERLEGMAASVSQIVSGMRAEIASKLQSGEGGIDLEGALADVNRRVAASERRQAQTIEAISIEIRRMSESVDRRLRSLESRNDDSAAEAVREEVAKLAKALEDRVNGIENREIAGMERMGAEVGRLAERFDERFDAVERRSADAIEHIGEQVARMAERQSQRHENTTRELIERLSESEERQNSRLNETLSAVETRINALDERTQSSISPVQKAVSSLAERLQAVEDGARGSLSAYMRTPASAPVESAALPEPEIDVEIEAELEAGLEKEIETKSVDTHDIDAFAEDVAGLRADDRAERYEDVNLADLVDDDEPDPFDQLLPLSAPKAPEESQTAVESTGNDWSVGETDSAPINFGWDDEADAEPPLTEPRAAAAPPLLLEPDEDLDVFAPEEKHEAAPPPGKNDYLANARRAAQANATQNGRKRPGGAVGGPTAVAERRPIEGLRGVNKVVLWGAAGALAMAIAGGAFLLKPRPQSGEAAPNKDGAQPSPQVSTASQPPPSADSLALDDNIPLGAASEGADSEGATSIAAAAEKQRAKAAARKTVQPPTEPSRTKQGPEASADAGFQAAALPLSARGGLSIEQAALRGDAVAQYELGLARLANAQTPEGIALLRRAANQGLAMAQYRLAKLFERGEGVPADILQARQWTERAAAAGNRKAMHDLGVYYARGEGAPLDEASAFRWFRQAADLGVADSQFNLGILFAQGRGTVANPSEAYYWFLVAARSGDADARARAATLEARMTPEAAQAVRARAATFTAKPASARANGEFGRRAWAMESAQSSTQPRS